MSRFPSDRSSHAFYLEPYRHATAIRLAVRPDTRAQPVGMTNRRAVNGHYVAIYRKWHLNVDMFRNSDRD